MKFLSAELAPAIYQEYVDKKCEYRVVVMGNTTFAAQLDTQSDMRTAVDWRLHHTIHGLHVISSSRIPVDLEKKCLKFMSMFGIVFGSFDFIQTLDDEFCFLEINQMGQFLWLDICQAFPMLSAFCDFVESDCRSFRWSGSVTDDLRFEQFVKTAAYHNFINEDSPRHLKPSSGIVYEERDE